MTIMHPIQKECEDAKASLLEEIKRLERRIDDSECAECLMARLERYINARFALHYLSHRGSVR